MAAANVDENIYMDVFRPTRLWYTLWLCRGIARAQIRTYDTRLNAILYAEGMVDVFPKYLVVVYSIDRRWIQRVSGSDCPLDAIIDEGR